MWGATGLSSGTNEILFAICFHLVRYLDIIILAITFTRMPPNSTFHLSVRDPLESLTRLNMCISDIRVWMIKNKLKIKRF